MGRRNRNKAKWRRSRYPGSSNNTEIMNTVHNQTQHDYHSRFVQEYESTQRRNKQLFEKAKSMVSKHFTDHTILTYFGNIKLEILRIIPLHPALSPELNLLRVMEQGSVLLGRIERCEIHDRKVYIRDIEDGEICFEYECSTDVVMPGRFIAIKNPKLNIFQDGKFGFRAEDEGCVLIIDVDHQQYDHQHSLNNMECGKCKRRTENLKRCTGCYGVSYCTRTCQRGDWADHKKICRTTTFLQENTDPQDNSSASINRKVDIQSPDENNTEIGGAEKKVDKSCEEEPKIQSNLEQEREGIDSHKEECAFCKLDASKKCSRCKQVFYCSKQCQKNDWRKHKQTCQNPQFKGQQQISFNPRFSPFQQFAHRENMSASTTTDDKFNKAIHFARMRFPFQDVISTLDEVPSEHHFFTPQTNAVLVAFIHRYHHYTARHCIWIQDQTGEEMYVAFYLDYDNPFPYFSWSSVRPGRFIAIEDPCIHYFIDGSVGLRIEDPSQVLFIDA